MSSATTCIESPVELETRSEEIHAADVGRAEQDALPLGVCLGEDLEVVDVDEVGGLSRGDLADAHHVGQVLGVVAERAAGGALHPWVVGRESQRVSQVCMDEARFAPARS